MKLNWSFFWGGVQNKNLSCGEYGYFLELHISDTRVNYLYFSTTTETILRNLTVN